MVAAIRNVDFRSITELTLAKDRHVMEKLAMLLGTDKPAQAYDKSEGVPFDKISPSVSKTSIARRRFA